MYVYFTSILVFSAMVIGPFMPGITYDNYGRMIVDREKARGAIMKVIPPKKAENTARCNTAMAQIDEMANAVDEYNAAYTRDGAEIVTLYVKHDSKPEDFQKVFARMDEAREKGQKKILDARFKMKEVMTPQEWKEIFNPKG
jgi:hypothetical protein